MSIKMELDTTSRTRELFWGDARDFVDELSDSELERVFDSIAELFGEEIPTLEDVNDFLSYEQDECVEALGYQSREHYDFVKENGNPDTVYYRCGDFYTADDVEEKFDNYCEACEEAFIGPDYNDWEDYAEDVYEVYETP